jgi:peptide/nickel transport system permease protein
LPALTLGLIIAPMFARMTNAALTEVLSSDYIRYARATGVGRSVLYRYALRNSLPPVLTVMGIVVVYLLGGDVLIEKVFAWPGIGLYAVNAVTNDDYAALQGFVLLSAAFTMLVYLVVDLIHSLVDPRVAFE